MKIFIFVLKMFCLWICLPPVLGAVLVVVPCYTLGYIWPGDWCGFKGAPPHTEAQFWTGIAAGLAIAFFFTWRGRRPKSERQSPPS